MTEPLPLPDFVNWPIFPFEGDLRVKEPWPDLEHDLVRFGEGDKPCDACAKGDGESLWFDEHWRLNPPDKRHAVPLLFLETREHLDHHELDDDLAAEYGRLLVRIDRAFLASGGIGRTHFNRWGDGGSHFHVWCYGRPIGTMSLLGFGMPMWAQILPPLPEDEWDAKLQAIVTELAKTGGTVTARSATSPGA